MGLSAEEFGIVSLSLRVAVVSVVFSLPFAMLVAYALARGRFPGRTLLDAFVHLPLVLPPVVVGFALLVLLGKNGPIGSVLARLVRHRVRVPLDRCGAGLGHHGFSADGPRDPPVDRGDRPARRDRRAHAGRYARVGVRVDHAAARAAGDHHRRRCCRSRAAWASSARRSRSCPTSRAKRETLPLAIYTFTQVPGGDAQALRLSLISVAISVVALGVSQWLAGRAQPKDRA